MKSSSRNFSHLQCSKSYQKTSFKDYATILVLYNFSPQLSQHLLKIWFSKIPTDSETICCCAETSPRKNALTFENRFQILYLIISEFKRINSLLFPLKPSEKLSGGKQFRWNKSYLIRLKVLTLDAKFGDNSFQRTKIKLNLGQKSHGQNMNLFEVYLSQFQPKAI